MSDNSKYLLGSLIAISFLGITYCSGWITEKYRNLRIVMTLINNIKPQNKLQDKPAVESFKINDNDRSASITYERMNKQHTIQVPYTRKYIAAMSQFKAELLRKDLDPIDITQQPGIPYLVDASTLGGYAIRITNQETGKSHNYLGNELPRYGEEIMETE